MRGNKTLVDRLNKFLIIIRMFAEIAESRMKTLRGRLGWSQAQMAVHLRLTQAAISLIERGQPESGPVSLLLDQLEAALARGERPEAPAQQDHDEARAE
jgi:transcriptional regulator with XRE-family HTH domain